VRIRRVLLCVIVIATAALLRPSANAARAPFPIKNDQVLSPAIGYGSIPAALLKDGTICRTKGDPPQCEPLGKIPEGILDECRDRYCTLDGLFDFNADGKLDVFLEWWPELKDSSCADREKTNTNDGCDFISLYVLKRNPDGYQPFMKLSSPTMGYAPHAWFLIESPRKVVVMTRCGGSFGRCLVYLDAHNSSLTPITDLAKASYYIEGNQIPHGVSFEDIDKDGTAEIFVEARGRDRTASQGAALFRWNGHGYQLWWPNWKSPPYVIYAQIVGVPADDHKEIVAVVDPHGESTARRLEVWKLVNGAWTVAAKKPVPSVDESAFTGYPKLGKIRARSREIEIPLTNTEGLASWYDYVDGRISRVHQSTTSR